MSTNTEVKDVNSILFNEHNMFNEEYYIMLMKYINELTTVINEQLKLHKTIEEVKQSILVQYDEFHKAVEKYSPEFSSILPLIFYPIFHYNIDNKSYRQYNIDIEFFKNIINNNVEDPDLALSIKSFKFENGILKEFVLHRESANISFIYNEKYQYEKMIFADGEEFYLNKNEN